MLYTHRSSSHHKHRVWVSRNYINDFHYHLLEYSTSFYSYHYVNLCFLFILPVTEFTEWLIKFWTNVWKYIVIIYLYIDLTALGFKMSLRAELSQFWVYTYLLAFKVVSIIIQIFVCGRRLHVFSVHVSISLY